MDNGPVRYGSCGKTWPKNLAPVSKGECDCPACSPDMFR